MSKESGKSKQSGTGAKRIQRATDKEEFIQALISEQLGVFREIWRVLLFAAQIGVKNNTREPLGSVETSKGIDQSTFGNSPVWPGILYLISIVEEEDTFCLGGSQEAEDMRLKLFQEYANGGLGILKKFFEDRTLDLDGLLAFIESQQSTKSPQPDLELSI